MRPLPPRPDLDQLRRQARDRLRAARAGDTESLAWFGENADEPTLASALKRLADEHGFSSWPRLVTEVRRRQALGSEDVTDLRSLLDRYPDLATTEMSNWFDHPLGAYPLAYVAMLRFDTRTQRWRDVAGTDAAARLLLDCGATVDGRPADRETPLITAASYGDAAVAVVLIDAGADIEARAAADSGGVPGATALTHAAVFGMTDVVDVLAESGSRIDALEVAAAVGDVHGWPIEDADHETRLRALVMAAHHQRLDVIDQLADAGTPIDGVDRVFGRHPLRLAAADGRWRSVERLLALGADARTEDVGTGRSALDECLAGRRRQEDTADHDRTESILRRALDAR